MESKEPSSSRRRERGSDDFTVPESVKNFCINLQRRVRARNVYEIQVLYEEEFNELTDKYFKSSPWPSPADIAPIVESDQKESFLVLYKELYYRHLYSKLRPSLADRIDSFRNFVQLFNILLSLRTDQPEVDLPSSWLWDLVEEFTYQFESFHHFRSNPANFKELPPEDIETLKTTDAWSAPTVVRTLYAVVKKAQIDKPPSDDVLEEPASPLSDKEEEEVDELDEGLSDEEKSEDVGQLFKILGHFCLIGLLRVHCLFGDYVSALKVLDPLDLKKHKKNLFMQVPACHATLYYCMGFAYMMLRRYTDAVKVFSSFLSYITRSRQRAKGYQTGSVQKRVDKIYGLLSIVASITSHRLDETLQNALREKLGDRLQRLQKGELEALQEAFLAARPKFVTFTFPSNLEDTNVQDDGLQLQLSLFLNEMQQRQKMADIYSYLKLCTTVSTDKLAKFLNTDEETCNSWLLSLKHKTRNLRWKGGSPLSGDWVSAADVDFLVNKDTIHVSEHKAPRQFGGFFIRQILKFEDTIQYTDSVAYFKKK